MTLIITTATKEMVFQVADTRLTAMDGSAYYDDNIKTTVVHCSDSKLLFSYTGLAYIDYIRTDKWLVNILKDNKVWEMNFPQCVKFTESELTKSMSRNNNLKKYPLTFVITGLGLNNDKRDIAGALITNDDKFVPKHNLINHQKIEGKFGSVFYQSDPKLPLYWSVYGAIDITPEMKSLKRQIEKIIVKAKTNQQLDEIMHYLVAILRLQRKSVKVGRLISDDCTVAHIGSDYTGSLFYFSEGNKQKRFPNIVSKEYVTPTNAG
ncbi:hypothetical protein ACFLUB_04245 [Chloroflexota bacterium]